MLRDPWHEAAEQVAREKHRPDPRAAAEDAEGEKDAIAHQRHASHEWREGANDRHEPGIDDGLTAVSLIEGLGLAQMLLFEQQRVRTIEDVRAGAAPKRVTRGVAGDGAAPSRW